MEIGLDTDVPFLDNHKLFVEQNLITFCRGLQQPTDNINYHRTSPRLTVSTNASHKDDCLPQPNASKPKAHRLLLEVRLENGSLVKCPALSDNLHAMPRGQKRLALIQSYYAPDVYVLSVKLTSYSFTIYFPT